jgi:hypothetical protein
MLGRTTVKEALEKAVRRVLVFRTDHSYKAERALSDFILCFRVFCLEAKF